MGDRLAEKDIAMVALPNAHHAHIQQVMVVYASECHDLLSDLTDVREVHSGALVSLKGSFTADIPQLQQRQATELHLKWKIADILERKYAEYKRMMFELMEKLEAPQQEAQVTRKSFADLKVLVKEGLSKMKEWNVRYKEMTVKLIDCGYDVE